MSETPAPDRPLFIAFENIGYRKNTKTYDVRKVLSEEPGPAHVLDVMSTREKNPWDQGARLIGRIHVRPGEPYFYNGDGPRAACGQQVKVVLAMAAKADDPDTCPDCAELMRNGEAVGRWGSGGGWLRRDYQLCGSVLRMEDGSEVAARQCYRQLDHDGVHRDTDGATWESGPDTFTPAPDGYV